MPGDENCIIMLAELAKGGIIGSNLLIRVTSDIFRGYSFQNEQLVQPLGRKMFCNYGRNWSENSYPELGPIIPTFFLRNVHFGKKKIKIYVKN